MIYLDNCSTTGMREEVINEMVEAMKRDFANPSSLHRLGFKMEKKVDYARNQIASYLKVASDEIHFTSGGTESNNMAIGMAIKKLKNRGNHIITSKIEHPSVLSYMKELEEEGFIITYLDIDADGVFNINQIADVLTKDTILVSLMHVNNEIGTILPLEEVRKEIDKVNKDIIFHVDGVQAFGKIPFGLKNMGVDMYSFSSHKIYGPKGIGGLYIDSRNHLDPVIYGGGQESGLRSGTENVPAIMAFGKATTMMEENFDIESEYVSNIREYFIDQLEENITDIKINCKDSRVSPYILSISINKIRAEVLLHYLEEDKIYISTSSACSSKGTDKSHVLKALGLSDDEIEGTIRICFSYRNTREDMDYVIGRMKEAVREIRSIIMR